MIYKTP